MLNVQGTEDCANRIGPCSQISHLKSGSLRACRNTGFDLLVLHQRAPPQSLEGTTKNDFFCVGVSSFDSWPKGRDKRGFKVYGFGVLGLGG